MTSWTKAAIDAWADAAELREGHIFRPVNKGRCIEGESMTPQAIRDVVVACGKDLGFDIVPYDLRRTFAKLAHKGGAGPDPVEPGPRQHPDHGVVS
jgi:integrase